MIVVTNPSKGHLKVEFDYYLDVYINVPTPVANPPRMPFIKLSRKQGIAEMSRPKSITGYKKMYKDFYINLMFWLYKQKRLNLGCYLTSIATFFPFRIKSIRLTVLSKIQYLYLSILFINLFDISSGFCHLIITVKLIC